jgi:hypothetical protein
MRSACLLVFSLVLAANAQDIRLGVERTKSLGHGFHRDVIAEAAPPNAKVFESVGHLEYLFYRDRKLGRLDECLVAPSGRAIVYQEATSGNIFVFDSQSGKTIQLTKRFPGLATRFVWHEGQGSILAFVAPSPQSPEGSGKWITLTIPKKT